MFFAKGPVGVFRNGIFVPGGKEFGILPEEAADFESAGFHIREEADEGIPQMPNGDDTDDTDDPKNDGPDDTEDEDADENGEGNDEGNGEDSDPKLAFISGPPDSGSSSIGGKGKTKKIKTKISAAKGVAKEDGVHS